MVLENAAEPTPSEKGQEQTQEPEVATQQAQETVESLQSQLNQLQEQLKKRDEDVRGLNKTLQQRAQEVKTQSELRQEIAGIQDSIELLATAVAAKGQLEEVEPSQRQDILAELRKQREKQEAQRKQGETQRIQQEYNQKADAIYGRAKVTFGDDDDSLERIEDLLSSGKIDRAEAKVTKAEQAKGVKPKNMETEEQRIERLTEERYKKKLEERGLLESFNATPSGRGSGFADIEAKYAAGEISTAEYRKAREKEGIQ